MDSNDSRTAAKIEAATRSLAFVAIGVTVGLAAVYFFFPPRKLRTHKKRKRHGMGFW